jgi:hypothetical protein
MLSIVFEPAISAIERPQTYALDRIKNVIMKILLYQKRKLVDKYTTGRNA